MIIRRIKLANFRSHRQYVLDCEDETALILGPNGSGKTSVLEGVYEALRGKSFRAADAEIVKRGEEYYRIELEYEDGDKVVVVYDANAKKKTFLVGDKKWARLPKKNRYPVVLFLPDDLHLVGASPTRKRDYFDRILGELDPSYAKALSSYNKALRQRNELLKSQEVMAEMLFSWNVLLAEYGTELRAARKRLVEELNEQLSETYQSIAENNDTIALEYKSDEGNYIFNLERDFQKDALLGHTSYGAHRDNYEFYFNEVEADGSASRGEVRSIVLAMKFIEAKLIEERTGRKPVVLLDDVFSELDAKRQGCLVKNFKDNQVIITSVEQIKLS